MRMKRAAKTFDCAAPYSQQREDGRREPSQRVRVMKRVSIVAIVWMGILSASVLVG